MAMVLVTDASGRAALSIIRSLGMRGIEVVATSELNYSTGALSKFCRRSFVYPSPEKNSMKFIKFILNKIQAASYDLIIPSSEFTTVLFSRHKEELERYTRVAVPCYEKFEKTYDKAKTLEIAQMSNVPYPNTVRVEDPSQLKSIARELSYPVVIKPRFKTLWVNNRGVVIKITRENYAYNIDDLLSKYSRILSRHKRIGQPDMLPLIQEYVPGTGYGVELLLNNGELRAAFAHRRIREYPVTGGASTLRESVPADEFLEYALRILHLIRWHGVAMVEFRLDSRDGKPKLMEVNGRFWGSLPLAIASGVDFPYLIYKMLTEGDVKPFLTYRLNVKQRWLIPGDFLWLISILKSDNRKLSRILEFIKSFSIHDDVISLQDPLPVLGALTESAYQALEVFFGRKKITGESV